MKQNYQPKPLFVERMKELLGKANYGRYKIAIEQESARSIRANTLKISPGELMKKLEAKGWKIKQPFAEFPEILVIEGKISEGNLISLEPGELGRSLEHLLGYYYVQEIASMLPVIALNPKPDETVLDLCASPGSKTTQIAARMKNSGTIIANDPNLDRIKILASNLERCGVTNAILTRKNGDALCRDLKEKGFKFGKILVDAPCSGEGTIRSTPKTFLMWNIHTVTSLSKVQKRLLTNAVDVLEKNGEIVYSTCTHSPEENEEVLDFIMKNHPEMKIEKIYLPVKCSPGVEKWQDKDYSGDVKYSCRIYPHITNTEGFFLAKMRKIK